MLPFGEVLVSIHQKVPEILRIEADRPLKLYSMSKMLPIGEVLVQISHPGAEILSFSFHRGEHFCRYIDMWLQIGQKSLFLKSASIEVRWPKSWWVLEDVQKCLD